MSRYIDANILKEKILEERDKIPLQKIDRYSFGVPTPHRDGANMRGGIRKALRCLEETPTADVVEVVRCKDCRWWEAHTYGSTIGRCENPRNGLVNEYSEDTDYCSYGERREQNEG